MDEGKPQPKDIKGFLKGNLELLTGAGILGGIATLLNELPFTWITYFLSFCVITAMALVWSEIRFLPTKEETARLAIFKLLLGLGFVLLTLNILLSFRIVSWVLMPHLVSWMFGIVILNAATRLKPDLISFRSNNPMQWIGSVLAIMAISLSASLGSLIVSVPFNTLLDEIDHYKSAFLLY